MLYKSPNACYLGPGLIFDYVVVGMGVGRTLVLEEGTGKEIVFRIFRSPWVGMSVDQLLWKANQAVFLVESIV